MRPIPEVRESFRRNVERLDAALEGAQAQLELETIGLLNLGGHPGDVHGIPYLAWHRQFRRTQADPAGDHRTVVLEVKFLEPVFDAQKEDVDWLLRAETFVPGGASRARQDWRGTVALPNWLALDQFVWIRERIEFGEGWLETGGQAK